MRPARSTGALCECYHSLDWGATLLDARLIAEGLLLMGIRYLVPHGFFASTHALAKHDAQPRDQGTGANRPLIPPPFSHIWICEKPRPSTLS